MCGITGAAWGANAAPLEFAVLERMTTVLTHRGPDDAGYYHSVIAPGGTDRNAMPASPVPQATSGAGGALGFRRLSIIDLAGGHQPLSNEDGSVWIAFNGEIYNYRELRPGLEQRGHRFRTSSDTETIVHLYEEYGPDCVLHLRGMFAFAIWDQHRRQLFLARDRIGKKPLIYRHEGDRLLFASELKGLLQVPGLPREIDPAALDEYLTYQYVPHPHSILRGFSKLPPAHWALFRDGRLELRRYWHPGYDCLAPEGHTAENSGGSAGLVTSEADCRKLLRETLTEAVRLRLRSDVPLGAFLSGGIDSTIITGLMQQLSDRPVQTFSIGFPVKSFDERSYARQAAEHLKTDHHEQVVDPAALSILPKLIWHYDEPFADSSAIPMMYLAEMTRRNVTVALSGDGGDELFAGYDRYLAVQLGTRFDRMPGFLRRLLAAPVWQRLPASTRQKSRRRRLKRLLSALAYPPERRYLKWISIFDDDRLQTMYTDGFKDGLRGIDAADFLLAAYSECPRRDFVTRTTCADVLTYLPCDILTKVDIATMANALEARCPFLDQEVIQLAARIPMEWKLRGSRGKRILVETFADLLPADIQTRKKMGFGVPLDHWFRGDLRPLLQDVLLDRRSLDRGIFRPQAVRQLVEEHVSNRWDHSYRLWSLLVLELWQQRFVDGAPAVPSPP
jgi:asparagine synthase (glutamine-hydrolysing)